MTEDAKQQALERIRANIERHSYHVYLVSGGPGPRYAYTIGLTPVLGAELLLAGSSHLETDQVYLALSKSADWCLRSQAFPPSLDCGLGRFSLEPVHPSWVSRLLLGASDYYGNGVAMAALQLVPSRDLSTRDTPDCSAEWRVDFAGPWRWLEEAWPFDIDSRAVAVTNLGALRGLPVTEVARWEELEWEMYAGSGAETPLEEVRVVPLGRCWGWTPRCSRRSICRLGMDSYAIRSPLCGTSGTSRLKNAPPGRRGGDAAPEAPRARRGASGGPGGRAWRPPP